MSTRSVVIIKPQNKSSKDYWLYHHHDGYPEGVGFDLLERSKDWGYWYESSIANQLVKDQDDEYEITSGRHTDIDYLYVIDCKKKKIHCYRVEWQIEKHWKTYKDIYQGEFGTEIDLEERLKKAEKGE